MPVARRDSAKLRLTQKIHVSMQVAESISQIQEQGYCVLEAHFPPVLIENCRNAFWPVLLEYLRDNAGHPNRGPGRHYLPMPFEPPCFAPEFFFDPRILAIGQGLMGERIVADQWGCDVPLEGSDYQNLHVDYRRPLFEEHPDLDLPIYMLVVSFGLVPVGPENGPIEIAPGTHRMRRTEALDAVRSENISLQPVSLGIGDVLIRHPWALHRGTPNHTPIPRALVSLRYVRSWYADESREVRCIPRATWGALSPVQQRILRFPVAG